MSSLTAGNSTRPDTGSPSAEDLRAVVFDRGFDTTHSRVRAAVIGLGYAGHSPGTYGERARNGYNLLHKVVAELGPSREIVADLPTLFALFDWAAIGSPDLFPILSGHFTLTVGAIQRLGTDTPYQRRQLDLLDDAGNAGVFLLTELGYGSNVLEMETEAVWDGEQRRFLLTTPSGAAVKFMPNVAAENVPKITIVAARLKVDGRDEGIWPFLVSLRDDTGTTPGIEVKPLPDKGYAPMDNAMIRFDHVALPYDAWLTGGVARIDEDGFSCTLAGHGDRFRHTIEQLQAGRIAMSAAVVAGARAALWLVVRYAAQRRTAHGVKMIDRDNVRRSLASCVARVYATTALANLVRDRFIRSPEDSAQNGLLAMLAKPILSGTGLTVLQECRERCGAQGMFGVNRITDYIGLAQGVITAEGDNQILQVAAGRILSGRRSTAPVLHAQPADGPWWTTLLAARERALATTPFTRGADEGTTAIGPSSHAMDLAEAAGSRLAADALYAEAAEVPAPARDLVISMATVFTLERIRQDAAWFLRTGLAAPGQVGEIDDVLAREYEALAAHLPVLVEAFSVSDVLIGTPIADDYIGAWLGYAGWAEMGGYGNAASG
jgi:acyl-CoA oxidase